MDILKTIIKRLFQYEARLVLRKYKPKIAAVAGSVGKTSAKDALYHIASKRHFVRKNERSFTSELGIPLTIIGCSQGTGSVMQWIKNLMLGFKLIVRRVHYPDWLILEIDNDKPGDVEKVADWLSPDILVLTAIGDVPSHTESFGTVERVLAAYRYLAEHVSSKGTVVYTVDYTNVREVLRDVEAKKIPCGLSGDATGESAARGSEPVILYSSGKQPIPTGISFTLFADGQSREVTVLGSIGIHKEYACLLAYSAARAMGIPVADCIDRVEYYKSSPGKMNIVSGMNSSIIIDDSYNASPVALQHAIDVLSRVKASGKKIAIIGDMFELGKYSVAEHKKMAPLLKTAADVVVLVGIRTRGIAEELRTLGFDQSKIFMFDDSRQMGSTVTDLIAPGDIILVKGSQMARMERVVEKIMRHPEDRKEFLIRQEPEWQGR